MIITITGKPCSGKSSVIQYFAKKYNFEMIDCGQMFREVALERGIDILNLNREKDASIDKEVDTKVEKIGKERLFDDIIFGSRTGWHLIPRSFKVFIDLNLDEQARRLLGSDRNSENLNISFEQAKQDLLERWNLENERYRMIYNIDNCDQSKFDCVVDSSNLTIEETAEYIYKKYLEYLKNFNAKREKE